MALLALALRAMLHRQLHKPGTAPATLIAPATASKEPPRITLIEYDKDTHVERQVGSIEEIFECRDNSKVSWINIDGLGDVELLRKLGAHFRLHPLALEDVLNTPQRPKLEPYEDHLFIVFQMVYMVGEDSLEFEQVSMFLGQNFLITIQEDTGDAFDPVRSRLRKGQGFARSRGHDYLAYALLDAVIDYFFPVLETVGEVIEALEDELVEDPVRGSVGRLHDLKRTLLALRRAAWPARDVVNALTRDDTGVIRDETQIFLRDCYDHTVQAMDIIESYRDLTAGMMDLYLSSISNRTNEIMRLLTVVTAIFIPLTFIAGIYGMNFDTEVSRWNMPELTHPFGYPLCLAAMAAIAVAMVAFFRRKRWL